MLESHAILDLVTNEIVRQNETFNSQLLCNGLQDSFVNHFFQSLHEIPFFNFYTFPVGGC